MLDLEISRGIFELIFEKPVFFDAILESLGFWWFSWVFLWKNQLEKRKRIGYKKLQMVYSNKDREKKIMWKLNILGHDTTILI